jgi:predicted RNA-binding protein
MNKQLIGTFLLIVLLGLFYYNNRNIFGNFPDFIKSIKEEFENKFNIKIIKKNEHFTEDNQIDDNQNDYNQNDYIKDFDLKQFPVEIINDNIQAHNDAINDNIEDVIDENIATINDDNEKIDIKVDVFDDYKELRGKANEFDLAKAPEKYIDQEYSSYEPNPIPSVNQPVNTNDYHTFDVDENENEINKLADSMRGIIKHDITEENYRLISGKEYIQDIPNPLPNYKPLFARYGDKFSTGLINNGTPAYSGQGFSSYH